MLMRPHHLLMIKAVNSARDRSKQNWIFTQIWFFPAILWATGDAGLFGHGCVGQLVGFFLGWLVLGRGRALSVGEVKFIGQILPESKYVSP